MHDLVPFAQFKKREKHLWRMLILVKLQASASKNLRKVLLLLCFFFTFFKIGQMAPDRAKHRTISSALAIHQFMPCCEKVEL